MRNDAIPLEEKRFEGVAIGSVEDYPSLHERHRIFPAVFENRRHERILDVAAGMGVVGKRIKDFSQAEILCNDICPTCLKTMRLLGLATTSFDIDNEAKNFPFPDGHFDAVIALATIEHVINVNYFLQEIHRILRKGGWLYLSAPNYSSLASLLPLLRSGRTFHDPMKPASRYEFYAHVRYFTFTTLVEFTGSFGFVPDTVYLALPESSSRYVSLKSKSKVKAFIFRNMMKVLYTFFSPRWASEPVICFRKGFVGDPENRVSPKKRVL